MTERNGAGHDLTILGLSNALLRNWRLIFVSAVLAVAAAAALTLLPKPNYMAESTFIAQNEQSSGPGIAGLAAQFGMNVGVPGSGPSLDFYGRLLRSRGLLAQVIDSPLPAGDGQEIRLAQYYEEAESADPKQRQALIGRLRSNVSVGIDAKSKMVTLRTYAVTPAVAESLNRRLLTLLDEFNQITRQSQAASERRFAEARMAEALAELRGAENALQSFYAQNQRFRETSQLRLEAGRLEREVAYRQELYLTLSQAYEQARIDEVRNTPVITVVEAPEGSAVRRRGLVRNLLLGLLLGLAVGVALAMIREAVAHDRGRYPEEYEEFVRLRRLTLPGLTRLTAATPRTDPTAPGPGAALSRSGSPADSD